MSTGDPSEPLSTRDPRHVGPYRLLGRLGQGGQGVVYLGEGPRHERVAVKVLKIEIRDDAKAKARFVREIAAARKVAPFCTARILAFDIEGDLPYVASEFISGPTLEQRVNRRGPVSGADLDRLAIGTAAAIAAVHGANVVHCDLKPANVILGPDWPRVIDFGIARAIDSTGTQTIMGSPAYMSPERYRNEDIGPASDIFSWAATIAFAAAGRAPFGHEAAFIIMHRVLDKPPQLSGLSPALEEMVRSCLQKDAAARPVATEILLRLVAKSGLTLEAEARRSIGELTTRVITKQSLRDIHDRQRIVPTQRRGETPVEAPQDAVASTEEEHTLRISGGRGETRKILPRPDQTTPVPNGAGLTAEAPAAGSPQRAPAVAGARSDRVRQASREVAGVALAVLAGVLAAVGAFLLAWPVVAVVAAGLSALVVAYGVRLLIAARLPGSR